VDTEDKHQAYKEKMKKLRKEHYQKAKERFEKSDYAKAMKEKQKRFRRLSYQLGKQRKIKATLEKEIREQEAKQKPPELTLIVNPEFSEG